MSHPYDSNLYKATIIRHVDADTAHVRISVGFDVAIDLTVRWEGIDSPERYTPAGKLATAYVNQILPAGTTCLFRASKENKEKFGRYLGTFFTLEGENLNHRLVAQGHAVPYDGGPRT